jgi:hypothetical protein
MTAVPSAMAVLSPVLAEDDQRHHLTFPAGQRVGAFTREFCPLPTFLRILA